MRAIQKGIRPHITERRALAAQGQSRRNSAELELCAPPGGESIQAWSLIEMIGVLALLSVAALLILPVFVKEVDKSAADQERATLKSFADAFQQYVQQTRTIPDQTTWYSAIATNLGFSTNDVVYNPRQWSHQSTNSRVFLIKPSIALGWGTNGLPYYQSAYVTNVANCPVMPTNLCLMIVSSIGKPLPATVASGVFTTANPQYFDDLWTNSDGSLPSDGAWSGWTGNASDVIVQRINLQPLFVHLLLGKYNVQYNAFLNAAYNIDNAQTPVQVVTIDGYFIQGSVLNLYTNTNSLSIDITQILSRDSSYIFEQPGLWRGSLTGSTMAGVMGIGDVVQQFLAAAPNVNAPAQPGNAQQALVVANMLSYMSNYNVWAIQYNYNNAALKSSLGTIQANMMSSIQNLYNSSPFPTNPSACLQ